MTRKFAVGDKRMSVTIIRSDAGVIAFRADQTVFDSLVKQTVAGAERKTMEKAEQMKAALAARFPKAVSMPCGVLYEMRRPGPETNPPEAISSIGAPYQQGPSGRRHTIRQLADIATTRSSLMSAWARVIPGMGSGGARYEQG